MTSHDVVNIARKKLGIKKIGHTGTLDPFASGLMLLLIGKATKLAFLFENAIKEYSGTVIFGNLYDTLDITGKIISTKEVNVTTKSIDQILKEFNTTYLQEPPIYSAIKVAGKKLYQYAREEKEVVINKREVTVYSLKRTTPFVNNEFSFSAQVSAGTYIRSLARDIGDKLNTHAVLKSLTRSKISDYELSDAVSLEEITEDKITPVHELFSKVTTKITLDDYLIKLVKNGVAIDERQIETNNNFLVYDKYNNLVAYYEVEDKNKYRMKYLF